MTRPYTTARHPSKKHEYPLVISPNLICSTGKLSELEDFVSDEQDELNERLLRHGAILFRGFDVSGPADFGIVVRSQIGASGSNYHGGTSPRTKVQDGIYTSTEWTPILRIPLHWSCPDLVDT